MKVLVVDDNRYIVRGLAHSSIWKEIGIKDVYTAYSRSQALEILEKEEVTILLCDIEMPGGSGLELVKEAREKAWRGQVIFLTSYAEFSYAQEAIRLGSIDYLLKPVEAHTLKKAVIQAIKLCEYEESQQKLREKRLTYEKKIQSLKEYFWRELIEEVLPAQEVVLLKEAAGFGVDCGEDTVFLPILIKVDAEEYNTADKFNYSFVIRNIMEECLGGECASIETIIKNDKKMWLVIIRTHDKKEASLEFIYQKCMECMQFIRDFLKYDNVIYIGSSCRLYQVPDKVKELEIMNQDYVGKYNVVLRKEDIYVKKVEYQLKQIQDWEIMLRERSREKLKESIRFFLQNAMLHKEINYNFLICLRMDIQQMAYAILKEKNIAVNMFLVNNENQLLFNKASDSVEDMQKYLFFLIDESCRQMGLVEQSRTLMDKLLEYIDKNIDQTITREELSSQFFLSSDYISRLFRKKKGISLGEYIQKRKIEKAQMMLTSTELSISDIAVRVGFVNFSYFSKIFKRITGVTPAIYRKRNEI
ncbi:two-component system, response regulator YesN [Anaerocolumna jejuensis DSM 15929]|uniref:Stage 0 sporulation protein A homolog n=1 Tax=Anaerocolumna jejuensis DSM 15929 TaxID=1121322 RepID=A0A1M6Z701_9FIRM|nr:response regulator [Anaerocolumna jejuensis]SHL26182.1 two-component system, response regulator YesN [Anaerocolumna jejuensis DSM 15929]